MQVRVLPLDEGMVLSIGEVTVRVSIETGEEILAALALALLGRDEPAAAAGTASPSPSREGSLDS